MRRHASTGKAPCGCSDAGETQQPRPSPPLRRKASAQGKFHSGSFSPEGPRPSPARAKIGHREISIGSDARMFVFRSRYDHRRSQASCRPLHRAGESDRSAAPGTRMPRDPAGSRGRAVKRIGSGRSAPDRVFMPAFSPHQDAALRAVASWLKSKPGRGRTPQVFRLFGYAGTGKTTLARHVAESVDGKVVFAAFTGKAALVMRSKGCRGASTIHSLIYRPRDSGAEVPSFDLWEDGPATKAKLIVIDECS